MLDSGSTQLSKAWATIAGDERAILDDLAALVGVDTSFPPGKGYAAFADLMEARLAPLGFVCRRVVVPPALWQGAEAGDPQEGGERVNLLAARRSGQPVASLYFHSDTVPAGAGWSSPPLLLRRDGDRLYGLGTADMKGAIAAALAALRAAERCGLALAYDPALLLCSDEEGGLYPGVRYLAEQGLIEGHLLNFNGGALPRIWAGCFGSLDLLIRVKGRGAHSGDPLGGINAAEEAIPILQALMALKAEVETRVSALPAPPHFEGRPLTARLTVAALHGGQKGSSLPALLEILVNRRYAPEEEAEAVRAELEATIRAAAARTRALAVETRVVGHLIPVGDPTGPHWPRWQAAVGRAFGYAPEAFRAWGSSTSSDMGFVQRAGIREIILGGLVRPDSRAHAPDEFTTVQDLVALARAILLYLSRDFTPPGQGRPSAPHCTKGLGR